MITYKIHLIRTGSTSEEVQKPLVGQLDLPLCPEGVDSLYQQKQEFEYPKVQQIYRSPLTRCQQTTQILYPDTHVVVIPELIDMNLGDFQGQTFQELRDQEEFVAWMENSYQNTPPNAETTMDFTQRIVYAIRDIFSDMMEEQLDNVGIVTHGGVIMTLLSSIALPQRPLQEWAVKNGCGWTIAMTPQMWMRDRAVEVVGSIPYPHSTEGFFLEGEERPFFE